MKKVFLYLTFIAGMVFVSSCSKDYLEVDQYDIIDPSGAMYNLNGVEMSLNGIYDLMYPLKGNNGIAGPTDVQQNWNFKPMMAFGNYPALDCQADGWDNEFVKHSWLPDKDMFKDGWQQCYQAVDRANIFLDNLAQVDASIFKTSSQKDMIEAEARGLRSFFYIYLAQNFGRIPMLEAGETYMNTPNKPRAESASVTWKFVVDDLKFAVATFEKQTEPWKPRNNQNGRITLGMAKAYLAQAYLYLAKDASSAAEANTYYDLARAQYLDIIESGPYQLESNYSDIHKLGQAWGQESLWEVSFYDFGNTASSLTNTTDAALWWTFMTASTQNGNGGWGAMYISYEFCYSFEPGDLRLAKEVVQRGQTNPYILAEYPADAKPITGNEFVTAWSMPNNALAKYWRQPVKSGNPYYYNPISAVWMRLAGVYLSYAECLFRLGQGEAADKLGRTGWDYIQMVRDRAWGDLNGEGGPAPDAKAFYTTDAHYLGYQAAPYSKPAWLVAITVERRHEFLAEYSFWYDLTRTDMAQAHLDMEYPVGGRTTAPASPTNRAFQYESYHAIYPIPYSEIVSNKDIGPENQNPGY